MLALRRRETSRTAAAKRANPAGRIRFVGGDALLELLDVRVAFDVLALQLVERRVEFLRARAQLAEEVRVLLRVMQLLGERLDVVQHRPQQRERRRRTPIARLADQVFESVDHRGKRPMLVADDRERRTNLGVRQVALDGGHQHRNRRVLQHASASASPSISPLIAAAAVGRHEDQVAAACLCGV